MTATTMPLPPPAPPTAATTSTGEQLAADPAMAGQHQPDTEIHGTCSERFARVRDAFNDLLRNRGGSRAPPRATTASPRVTSSARSCAA